MTMRGGPPWADATAGSREWQKHAPRSARGTVAPTTLCFWTFSLQDCETITQVAYSHPRERAQKGLGAFRGLDGRVR